MEIKNVVIAMMCASIVILSIAAPISAVELENSGVSGEIDGTGAVTGSVSLETTTDRNGAANIEASIEASVELDGPGSAKCSQEGPVTHTAETELGTIVVGVSEDSKVEAAVEVVGEGSASADAYVGTTASLGESEVEIESKISSEVEIATDGGSASATASATGTTTGDGLSYATGCPPAENDATSHAEVSGNTEANAAVSGTAEAESYAAIGSTDYAGHYTVDEESYIEAGSYAWSADDNCRSDEGSKASADSSANGDAYQDGQAENCARSATYAAGDVSTAVATQGVAEAESDVYIWSYGYAEKDGDYAYVDVDSDIDAESDASSGTDGIASADAYADGDTGAAGSACGCVFLDTSAIGIGSTAVQTEGDASADSDSDIWSYGDAYKDTDGAGVHEYSEIWTDSEADSGTDGKASAGSASIGYTGAGGSACGCVFLDTSAIGIGSTAVQTEGDASADSDSDIWSYGDAYKDTDGAGVHEYSSIDAGAHAGSVDCKASAESSAKGYTDATGSACDCADSWTNAKGAVQVKTESVDDAWITAYARLTSDGWIVIGKEMGANSVIHTGATAMHNSNSAGTATADGSTEAGASDSCAGEWVGTGIIDGEGDTIVNPFDWMSTTTYAGSAYANAIPDGFEAINFVVYIDTSGPNDAFSFTEAIAMIPAPIP
ncbi:hypothetical protein C4E22_05035 [ANME-1 cluster archaeon AG-394-G06]|nr:hypothetical protein [ANME-1 cluster archaeon AG-394-G06]